MLATDPCSLLDPVRDGVRFRELSRDHDGQRGRSTPASECEARLALTLEARGLLEATVNRPSIGDAEDGFGQIWDFKAPRSREAIRQSVTVKAALRGDAPPDIPPDGYKGEFNLSTELQRVRGQQRIGKGVVLDLRRLTGAQAQTLIDGIAAEPSIDQALVKFFPVPEDVLSLAGGDPERV